MDKKTYTHITLFSCLMIAFAFILNSPLEIKQGLITIIQNRSDLTTDFFALANPGATLINGALLMLLANLYLQAFKVKLTGNTITAIVLMMTYGLFGKNLFNVWPFILGSFAYYLWSGEPSSNTLPIGLLATGFSPFVSYFPLALSGPTALIIGFIIAPCSRQVPKLHKGLSLFNTGFTLGILSTIIYQVMRLLGTEVAPRMIFASETNLLMTLFLALLFILMIVLGDFSDYKAILYEDGFYIKDYYNTFGYKAALTNAGMNGLIALAAVLIIGAPINGVSSGCILIVSAFGFNGSNIRTIIPIFLAFYLGHFLKLWNLHDAGPLMAMLLGTSLAPLVGHYGIIAGMIASILVGLLAPITNSFHAGLSLLNTGFACGLVATALYPLLSRLKNK